MVGKRKVIPLENRTQLLRPGLIVRVESLLDDSTQVTRIDSVTYIKRDANLEIVDIMEVDSGSYKWFEKEHLHTGFEFVRIKFLDIEEFVTEENFNNYVIYRANKNDSIEYQMSR